MGMKLIVETVAFIFRLVGVGLVTDCQDGRGQDGETGEKRSG